MTDTTRGVLKQRKQLAVTLSRVSRHPEPLFGTRPELTAPAATRSPLTTPFPSRSRGAGEEAGRHQSPQQPDRAFPQHPRRPGPLGEKRVQASGPGCQGCSPPVAMATAPRRHYLPPAPTARSSNLRAASRACAPPPAPSPPPGGSEHAQWPRPGCVRRGPLEGGEGGRGLRGG